MDRLIRRAIFSKEKKIAGYFYFLSNSKEISRLGKSSVYPIMRELLYESGLSSEKKIFMCITPKDLNEDIYPILPLDKTIIGITEVIENPKFKEVINMGYKVMLEVEEYTEEDIPNIDLISYIRCNINNSDCKKIIDKYKDMGKKVIVQGIDSEKLYAMAEKLNPDFYEGLAVVQQMAQITSGDNFLSSTIEKLNEILKKEDFNVEEIYNVARTDSKLVVTLLRIANSLGFTNKHDILTLKKAIFSIGQEKMRYTIALLSQGKTNDDAFMKLIKMDLYRAEFVSELNKSISSSFFRKSKLSKLSNDDAYIIGLFSNIDILNQKSMKETLVNLNQSIEVEDALVYKEGVGGILLKLVCAYNEEDRRKVLKYADELGIKINKIDEIYTNVLRSVNSVWRQIHGNV